MEPIRRAALVEAAIVEIGNTGSLEVTVSQIAKRAGVSSALAHHYFGGKEQIFLGAMRFTLSAYGAEVRKGLASVEGHRNRLDAIVRAGFTPTNFRREVIAAWLNFYVLAQSSNEALRLLTVYQRRLKSNLVHDLRPLVGADARDIAARIAGLIDGLYLHHALRSDGTTNDEAEAQVRAALETEIAAARATNSPQAAPVAEVRTSR
ncbi:TetR family transcriptional regulator [Aliiruegeria haliotis]|uniref:HTH-type transcriptional regulator BetI n=1 Tax=Aliiruegeria haliotis TaxID=1280846 RepID=A0A2T0RTB2_9RHOB|nr:TetR family transcriptional regulator [Aliiruegeria haliotis]